MYNKNVKRRTNMPNAQIATKSFSLFAFYRIFNPLAYRPIVFTKKRNRERENKMFHSIVPLVPFNSKPCI